MSVFNFLYLVGENTLESTHFNIKYIQKNKNIIRFIYLSKKHMFPSSFPPAYLFNSLLIIYLENV